MVMSRGEIGGKVRTGARRSLALTGVIVGLVMTGVDVYDFLRDQKECLLEIVFGVLFTDCSSFVSLSFLFPFISAEPSISKEDVPSDIPLILLYGASPEEILVVIGLSGVNTALFFSTLRPSVEVKSWVGDAGCPNAIVLISRDGDGVGT